jgi:Tfp pilus assembly protein PilN
MMMGRRPRHILALYVEARRLEILRAERQWRTWRLEPAEQHSLPEGESLFDYLARLNLRPKAGLATALMLFLSRSHYAFGRECYPLALQDRLEEALTFDWQENLFHDDDQTLRFTTTPAAGRQQLIVPIFSLSQEVYDKFHQALGASLFSSLTVIPSAMAYPAVFASDAPANGRPCMRVLGRVLGPAGVEIHRYLNDTIIDSFLVQRGTVAERLFRETLRALVMEDGTEADLELRDGPTPVETDNQAGADKRPHIEVLCSPAEEAGEVIRYWVDEGLTIRPRIIDGSLLTRWMEHLVGQDRLRAFGAELRLKPWQPPRILVPLVVVLAIYGVFGAYQWHGGKRLARTAIEVQNLRKQLEAQWKPIEQLQANISKLKDQQKALAEFDQQSYPVFELFNLLTQVTPEDTWLDFFSLTNKELQIRGESKSAARYLSELSKVEGFSAVSFASPVSRNPSSDKERFNVRIQLDIDRLRKTLVSKEADITNVADEPGDNLEISSQPALPKAAVPTPEEPKAVGRGDGLGRGTRDRLNTLPRKRRPESGVDVGQGADEDASGPGEMEEVQR